MIHEGKVRFTGNVHFFKVFRKSEREEMLSKIEHCQTPELHNMFKRLAEGPNQYPLERFMSMSPVNVARIPPPDHRFTSIFMMHLDQRLPCLLSWYNINKASIKRHERKKSARKPGVLPPDEPSTLPNEYVLEWIRSIASPYVDDDPPKPLRSRLEASTRDSPAPLRPSFRPYHRGVSVSTRSTLHCSEVDEGSESGDSEITLVAETSRTLVDSPRTNFAKFKGYHLDSQTQGPFHI